MSTTYSQLEAAVFETRLGFFGAVVRERTILKIVIGQHTVKSVRQILTHTFEDLPGFSHSQEPLSETLVKLRSGLTNYALGQRVNFAKYHLDLGRLTAYQRRVSKVVRSIPYGEALSYSQVAALSGSPRAARAVGNVMANNQFPILIPCHRVLSASGKIGGFSAPGGVSFKQTLLDLESSGK